MGCGCFPDVRGLLDQALDDRSAVLDRAAELAEYARIEEAATPPDLPAALAEDFAAGRLDRLDGPSPGAVALYLDEARAIAHAGRVDADGLVVSRWRDDLVCRHGLFDLPRRFGEMVVWVDF